MLKYSQQLQMTVSLSYNNMKLHSNFFQQHI